MYVIIVCVETEVGSDCMLNTSIAQALQAVN